MKERGIIFTAHSVKAILRGFKIQTRRVMRIRLADGQQPDDLGWESGISPDEDTWFGCATDGTTLIERCPYGKAGDRLYVKEAWRNLGGLIEFRATSDALPDGPVWRSPLFLPRKCARLVLEVVSVKVERLQDISERDARFEGAVPMVSGQDEHGRVNTHRTGFVRGWESINGKRPGCAWSDNPWVWVVEFRKCERSAP